jgi:Mn-dependent DtxR family transcriptional regulator
MSQKDARRTVYITCPHCGEGISMSVQEKPKKQLVNWERVDWSQSTLVIAKALGVARSSVAMARRKMAPETIGQNLPHKKYNWKVQDWRMSNGEIAQALGTSESYVSTMRRKFAPGTLRDRQGESE